ncbi:hypothetical protein J2Z37_000827 [Ammoniphilus resinae]|uniref:Uncharacterized protein n=1 Tax=Ammoniphilus resinae TaxID=861532 RepID=A0ABS4GKP4_9BACL|nr:hypothetical protein [Ammoniphilus resinae]
MAIPSFEMKSLDAALKRIRELVFIDLTMELALF